MENRENNPPFHVSDIFMGISTSSNNTDNILNFTNSLSSSNENNYQINNTKNYNEIYTIFDNDNSTEDRLGEYYEDFYN